MSVTQQYQCGELAWRLAMLEDVVDVSRDAVHQLRREAELAAPSMLGSVTRRALRIADTICWQTLEQGNLDSFNTASTIAADLHQFATSAGLINEP